MKPCGHTVKVGEKQKQQHKENRLEVEWGGTEEGGIVREHDQVSSFNHMAAPPVMSEVKGHFKKCSKHCTS